MRRMTTLAIIKGWSINYKLQLYMNKASFSFPRNFKQFQAIRSKFIYIFIQDVKILLSKSF